MNILIVGCGKVGANLANTLWREGHDVSIVDRDEQSFDHLDSGFNGFTTTGVPIDQDVLINAGIENCDALAAVSQDDNVNIMVSQLAREIFNVPKVLARIYDPKREDVFSHFGLHTVCPTNLTVSAVRSALLEETQDKLLNVGSHTIKFKKINVPKHLIDINATEVELEDPQNQSLFAVEHSDLTLSFQKDFNKKLKETDKLILSVLVD
jgi:trk system potassium uptake protein TrkA